MDLPNVTFSDVEGTEKQLELLEVTKEGEEILVSHFIELNLIAILPLELFAADQKILFCRRMGANWVCLRKYFFKKQNHTGTQFFFNFYWMTHSVSHKNAELQELFLVLTQQIPLLKKLLLVSKGSYFGPSNL